MGEFTDHAADIFTILGTQFLRKLIVLDLPESENNRFETVMCDDIDLKVCKIIMKIIQIFDGISRDDKIDLFPDINAFKVFFCSLCLRLDILRKIITALSGFPE